ncbi:MAG: hypothetical protein QXU18_11235 [Thermoplasmatales archaeon]
MPPQEKREILDIFALGDLIDRAIVFLTARSRVPILSLQKGIFLYLYSYAITKGYDFSKLLKLAAFEPFKYGPFSDMVASQAETLVGDGTIEREGSGERYTFIGTFQNLKKYNFDEDEERLLKNVKNLVETLDPLELTFYIYFNPLIDKSLRKHFTSNSEIKDRLINNKEKYVKSLLKKGVIDDKTADLILYGSNQS